MGGRGAHLGELAEAVEGVDIGGLEVGEAREGLVVESDALDGRQRGALAVRDVGVQRDGVPDELDGRLREAKVYVQLVHRHHQQVAVLVRARLRLVVLLDVSAAVVAVGCGCRGQVSGDAPGQR